MGLVGNVSLVEDIHQWEGGPQTGICEARRGGFVPWELRSPEQRSSSIGCDASSVASPMGKLYMTTIRTVKIERLSRLEGVSGECRRRLFGVPGPIRGARGRREDSEDWEEDWEEDWAARAAVSRLEPVRQTVQRAAVVCPSGLEDAMSGSIACVQQVLVVVASGGEASGARSTK